MKALAALLPTLAPALAGVTYVDATPENTTLADGTALVESAAPSASHEYSTGNSAASADNRWRLRTGFANDGVWASHASSDSPALRTTLAGMVPGGSYAVRVFYWVAGDGAPAGNNEWDLRSGSAMESLSDHSWNDGENLAGGAGLFEAPAPLLSEGNRRLFGIPLGNLTADASGEIVVYVDDFPGNDDRTWYDGLGYGPAETEPPVAAPPFVEIAPDGTWTWFNDERSIFHQGHLFTGYVRSNGQYGITRFDLADGSARHMVISTAASQQTDDHNNPSLTSLPDGRILAVYSKHGSESRFYHRSSLVADPDDDADWGPEQVVPTPARSTYANTFRLTGEGDRIYNFNRGINYNPTLTRSDDDGENWGAPLHLIDTGTGGTRPYPRYCANGLDRVDLIYTDGHPRNDDNSIYHLHYRDGALRSSDGSVLKPLADAPLDHDGGERGSVVYPYSAAAWGPGEGPDDWIPGGRAWTWDIDYGADGHPVCAFQVQRDNVTGSGWNHDRIYYYYARWTGTGWQRRLIAHGGRGLYSAEDDYGGGMAIDPEHPNVVYISSNAAAPFELADLDDVPLRAHERYELWRGVTHDGGMTFSWTQLTEDSDADNLRPIVPHGHGFDRAVVWLNGTYSTYQSFDTRILAILDNDPSIGAQAWDDDGASLTWTSSVGKNYRIGASSDLDGFPFDAAADIPSQGRETTHRFPLPPALEGSPRVFLRVEEQ